MIGRSWRPIKKKASILEQIDKLKAVIDNIPEGAFPSGTDLPSQLAADFRRNVQYRGDNSVFQFQQLWGPISVGQIDRGMFDEKGVRAIQAFQKQLGAADKFPPKAALKAYLDNVRESLVRSGTQNISEAQKLGFRPEVLDVMREVWAPYGDTGKGPSPLKPNLPPGTHLEGGALVSDDGKHQWDGQRKAWIPRTPTK